MIKREYIASSIPEMLSRDAEGTRAISDGQDLADFM